MVNPGLWCDLCGVKFIKLSCFTVPNPSTGSLVWKCNDCSKLSILALLGQVYKQLSKVNEIECQLKVVKEKLQFGDREVSEPVSEPASYVQAPRGRQLAKWNSFTRRNDSVSSQSSLKRNEKRRRVLLVKVNVITGSSKARCDTVDSKLEVVERKLKVPRRHYFISRVSIETTVEDVKIFCSD